MRELKNKVKAILDTHSQQNGYIGMRDVAYNA